MLALALDAVAVMLLGGFAVVDGEEDVGGGLAVEMCKMQSVSYVDRFDRGERGEGGLRACAGCRCGWWFFLPGKPLRSHGLGGEAVLMLVFCARSPG